MEVVEENLWRNRDWDPVYLRQIFDSDFNDFTELWNASAVSDMELIQGYDRMEYYAPITEDKIGLVVTE